MKNNMIQNINNGEAAFGPVTRPTPMANHRSCGGALPWLGWMLFMTIALLLCLHAPAKANEGAAPTDQNTGTPPCKGLEPYNNIDELLYQFYINLESDCLFEMSTADLEKIWGIKILDEERFNPQNYQHSAATDFYFKPYKSEKDAFYIERIQYDAFEGQRSAEYRSLAFVIKTTKEYYKTHGDLFPATKLSEILLKYNPTLNVSFSRLHVSDYGGITNTAGDPSAYTALQSSDYSRSIGLTSSNEVWFKTYNLKPKITEKALSDLPDNVLSESAIKAKNTPCKGLKLINDVDELVYQFYINFDSDCLFAMSKADLEKIWGIKLHCDYRNNAKGFNLNDSADSSSIKDDEKGFYVVISEENNQAKKIRYFEIKMTEDYAKKYTTFFPNSFFPRFLPQPVKEIQALYYDGGAAYEKLVKNNFMSAEDADWHKQLAFDSDCWDRKEKCGVDNNQVSKNQIPIVNMYSIYYNLFNSYKTHKIIFYETRILFR